MTVGELKRSLEGVNEELEVVINFPYFHKDVPRMDAAQIDTDFYVVDAKFSSKSSISNEEFSIVPGLGFGY